MSDEQRKIGESLAQTQQAPTENSSLSSTDYQVLTNSQEQLRQQGHAAENLLTRSTETNNLHKEANMTIEAALSEAVATSIAVTTKNPHKLAEIKQVTTRLMQQTMHNFAIAPFAEAREKTHQLPLAYMHDLMQTVGLDNVAMTEALDTVDIRHMMYIVEKYVSQASGQALSLEEIQHTLQTSPEVRPDDVFRGIIPTLTLLPDQMPELTQDQMTFLEVLVQLQDATYAYIMFNKPHAFSRDFNPDFLQVYPLSLQNYYTQKKHLGQKNALVLTAFTLLKNCRGSDGSSLTPYLT